MRLQNAELLAKLEANQEKSELERRLIQNDAETYVKKMEIELERRKLEEQKRELEERASNPRVS